MDDEVNPNVGAADFAVSEETPDTDVIVSASADKEDEDLFGSDDDDDSKKDVQVGDGTSAPLVADTSAKPETRADPSSADGDDGAPLPPVKSNDFETPPPSAEEDGVGTLPLPSKDIDVDAPPPFAKDDDDDDDLFGSDDDDDEDNDGDKDNNKIIKGFVVPASKEIEDEDAMFVDEKIEGDIASNKANQDSSSLTFTTPTVLPSALISLSKSVPIWLRVNELSTTKHHTGITSGPILPPALPLPDDDLNSADHLPLQARIASLLHEDPSNAALPGGSSSGSSARLIAALTQCLTFQKVIFKESSSQTESTEMVDTAALPVTTRTKYLLACNDADTSEGFLTTALLSEVTRRGRARRREDGGNPTSSHVRSPVVGVPECYGLVLAVYGRCGRIWTDLVRWMMAEMKDCGEGESDVKMRDGYKKCIGRVFREVLGARYMGDKTEEEKQIEKAADEGKENEGDAEKEPRLLPPKFSSRTVRQHVTLGPLSHHAPLWLLYITAVSTDPATTALPLPQSRDIILSAYEEAIEVAGTAIDCYLLWRSYVTYVKALLLTLSQQQQQGVTGTTASALPSTSHETIMVQAATITTLPSLQMLLTNTCRTAAGLQINILLRQVYQRALAVPQFNMEELWREYELFERILGTLTSGGAATGAGGGGGEQLTAQLLAEMAGVFATARAAHAEREVSTLERDRLPVAPRRRPTKSSRTSTGAVGPAGVDPSDDGEGPVDDPSAPLIRRWIKFLARERTNPLRVAPGAYGLHIRQCFREFSCVMSRHPEVWEA
eukprot:CAMPEP_0113299996 /NCGR_PEP_ID=MMETSP0010_2-20120614/1807_1 /TAXON_ID=216773 ORGANISM="Corethron hystrix, Strain 308" /NCGR_SAMPLE_ID=MMETSP0010_2 /ASSEMBLY_ACC=CAM_ASM_000155 /LENGTH=779 /DNA_ID=CAMNT_0000153341 /DNA_START=176 /DNA_END=2512 /DNA_ORIENTATION=- /assembly_acc=CAM_ASM_000155